MNITKGKTNKPPRIVIYGTEGIGKTTFASQSNKPILIPIEEGADNIEVDKMPLSDSKNKILDCLRWLYTQEHEYTTCIVDTWDTMEGMFIAEILSKDKANSLSQACGGYGAGKGVLLGMTREIINALQFLRDKKGMTIIILAHSKSVSVNDPRYGAYDQFSLSCVPDIASQLIAWADVVGFANSRMRIDADTGLAKEIGANGGNRVLHVVGTPAFVAKNRYDMKSEVPLNWNEFNKEITK